MSRENPPRGILRLGGRRPTSRSAGVRNQAYLLGSMTPIDVQKEQALLAANPRLEALRLMHEYLAHEIQVLELRQQIATQAQSEMSREQLEFILAERISDVFAAAMDK